MGDYTTSIHGCNKKAGNSMKVENECVEEVGVKVMNGR
jgi:hypothetical protein